MATKEELVQSIKDWMRIENEMKALQKELKGRRVEKKRLADDLVSIMKQNEIDCFDLSGGKLMYTKTKVKTALSKKHLIECLEKYFAQDADIKPDEVCEFILDSRPVKENEGIRHKPNKKI